MKDNDFFRFSIMVNNGQGETFARNLSKIIKLVLFDESPDFLTVSEILSKIKEQYGLVFTDREITQNIKEYSKESFDIKICGNGEEIKYSLIANEIEKVRKNIKDDKLGKIIYSFLKFKNIEDSYKEKYEELIKRYIYYVFNNDTKTLLSLLNYKNDISSAEVDSEFSNEEKNIINEFINWDNKEKDVLIYEMVSSCFEYCMMTVKKNKSSYNQVFNGKQFYLDTNVIFRLAGFNNLERKEVIRSFVDKCKENNITLLYTNFTQQEIYKTIERNVKSITEFAAHGEPISYEAMKQISPKYENLGFYYMYTEWLKTPGNSYSDFNGFTAYLKKSINKVLEEFKFDPVETFTSRTNNKESNRIFQNAINGLKEYKTNKKYRYAPDEAVNTDIENYLYVLEKNKGVSYNSFVEKKYYLISADHQFINWSEERIPGVVPTIVLPSVWYSILLKYSGRTVDDNDYKAFTQFLKLPIAIHDDNATEKTEILARILELDEPKEIKEAVAFDINEKLHDNELLIENVKELVEESHEYIISKTVDAEVKKVIKEKEKEFTDKSQKEKSEHEQKIITIQSDSYSRGKKEGEEKGKDFAYNKMAEKIAEKNKKRILYIRWAILIFFILVFTKSLYKLGIEKIDFEIFMNSIVNTWSGILTFISLVMSLFIIPVLKCSGFLSTDKEEVLKKLKK